MYAGLRPRMSSVCVYLCVCLCSSPTAAHLVLCFLLAISEEVKKGIVVLL
jgi:hypothetical protein